MSPTYSIFKGVIAFLLISPFCPLSCSSTDSLFPGDMLHNTSEWIYSSNGKWGLGFHAQEGGMFLSIMSRKEAQQNYIVWMGNRNDPVQSGILTLDRSGSLKILHDGGDPIYLYSPPNGQSINNTVATLLDSSNFVLNEVYPNGSVKRMLWQNFDYPTDTLVPGMKLGVNHKTGQYWSLISCLTDKIMDDGAFTLTWEPEIKQLAISRRGQVYWRSGELVKGTNKFKHISEEAQRTYEYTIVSNGEEEYLTYTSTYEYSAWVILSEGQLFEIWGDEIANGAKCSGYKTDGGCQKWEQPKCRHMDDTFNVITTGFAGPGVAQTSNQNTSLTTSDCRDACWKNCNCSGFSILFTNSTGCIIYEGTLSSNVLSSGALTVYMLEQGKMQPKGTRKWIWIGVFSAVAFLISAFCILCLVLRKRKQKGGNRTGIENAMLGFARTYGLGKLSEYNDVKRENDLEVFSYACLLEATNSFSSENMLGEGGFGPVYKGLLPTGKEVAVKSLSKRSGQGVIEFKNELQLISELQHVNLVRLLGYCIYGEDRMLVYEYMPNKSLDYFLFDPTCSKLLDWNRRFNIIEGIAQGLLYLHKYSRLKVVHRDLKASNILLDKNMNPKISDFGMARIFTLEESEANTKRIVGTYGYMSPEYAMEGLFSLKSDVYSFGVLLLEIVSGRRNNSFYNPEDPLNLIGHAWELWREGLGLELIDQTIISSCIPEQCLRCIHVGLLCVEECAADRPNMSEVVNMLSKESLALAVPKRPAFFHRRKANGAKTSAEEPLIGSVNGLTISSVVVR